jgi:hypothetical protein
MKKKVFCGMAACMMIAAVAAWNVYVSQSKNEMALSDVTLANVEALAQETWGCSSCGTCTGTYYICFSEYDRFWSDTERNCGALDITLIIMDC